MSKLVAIDIGHKDVKATHDGKKFHKSPSVISIASESSGFSAFGNRASIIEVDGRKWITGEDAAMESHQVEQTIDRGRTQSMEYRVLALANLARIFPRGMGGINLVTGLPNSELDDSDDVIAGLKGTHNVKIDGKTFGYGIENVSVNPQSFGTLCSQGFYVNGKNDIGISDENVLSRPTLYIDIGSRTINFMQFVGQRFIEPGSGSEPQGVYRVAERLMPVINKTFKLEYGLYETLVAFEQGYVMVDGQPEDITDLSEPYVSELADIAISRALTRWPKKVRDGAYAIYLAGGGAISAGAMIRERLSHKNVIQVKNPVLSNVAGYYIYGLWLDENGAWEK